MALASTTLIAACELGATQSPGGTVSVKLASNEAASEYFVDGKRVGGGRQIEVALASTPHEVVVKAPGYNDKKIYLNPPFEAITPYSVTFMVMDRRAGGAAGSGSYAIAGQQIEPGEAEALPNVVAGSGNRVALVVGNSKYRAGPLPNPVRDARLLSERLSAIGFDVVRLENASQAQMRRAIDDFGKRMESAQTALFFYAGHGLQIDGENYLIPVDANVRRAEDVDIASVALSRLLKRMNSAPTPVKLVILDACRDNPFEAASRSMTRGLALITSAPTGTIIAYATSPGTTAADGKTGHSPYTAALAEHINHSGWKVEDVFKAVSRDVKAATDGVQQPWLTSSLDGDFYFVPAADDEPAQ